MSVSLSALFARVEGPRTGADCRVATEFPAVTGCSYTGKMAPWAGAFDGRIALTIPEESGGGQPGRRHLDESRRRSVLGTRCPERTAFSQAVASGHCAFPSSQAADVDAFVKRFLLGCGDDIVHFDGEGDDTRLCCEVTIFREE